MKADKLRIKGRANQLIGRGRVMTAGVSGSREGQLKGKAQQWKGRAQVTMSDVRQAATGRFEMARARFRRANGAAVASKDGNEEQSTQQKDHQHRQ